MVTTSAELGRASLVKERSSEFNSWTAAETHERSLTQHTPGSDTLL